MVKTRADRWERELNPSTASRRLAYRRPPTLSACSCTWPLGTHIEPMHCLEALDVLQMASTECILVHLVKMEQAVTLTASRLLARRRAPTLRESWCIL
ncbi:hypothetical protein NDU88_000698 [Pleurodeles waltl]|uniref:Uncharacterized protein n=1 Tax=Pleurodeles waltl TaxID=8319 RepID=A0AAV7MIV2_PLEWA|nr:hypothetical protein NDU88_000698 [Pleurodeles waltl]